MLSVCLNFFLKMIKHWVVISKTPLLSCPRADPGFPASPACVLVHRAALCHSRIRLKGQPPGIPPSPEAAWDGVLL